MSGDFLLFWTLSCVISFFGTVLQNISKICLPDFIIEKTNQQRHGSCIVKRFSQFLHKPFKKQSFLSANTHGNYCVRKDYSVATLDDKLRSLPHYRSDFIKKATLRSCNEIRCILLQLPARGLSVYSF